MRRVASFLRWWGDELIAMLPQRWRELCSRSVSQLRVVVSGSEIIVCHESGGRTRELWRQDRTSTDTAEIANSTVDAHAQQRFLLTQIQALKSKPSRVMLAVAPGLSLTKELQLPLAAQQDLTRVLTFEMDRQTPFRADRVYFDYRIIRRDSGRKHLSVRIGVVPRDLVNKVLALLSDLDLRMSQPGAATDSNWDGRTFLLVPASAQRGVFSRINPALLALNGVLLVVVVLLPFYRQRSELAALGTQLDQVRQAARDAMSLQEQVDRLAQEIKVAVDRKSQWPSMVELVNELTVVLPNSTWLNRLEIKEGEIHLQGVSSSASSLIALIEESETFADVRFQSPVTQDTRTGRERFHLSARIVKVQSQQ
jgi:general secretion pathway protein L